MLRRIFSPGPFFKQNYKSGTGVSSETATILKQKERFFTFNEVAREAEQGCYGRPFTV